MSSIIAISLNAVGIIANLYIGNKSRIGPILWAVISCAWIAYFVLIAPLPMMADRLSLCIGPLLNLVMQIRTIVKWSSSVNKH